MLQTTSLIHMVGDLRQSVFNTNPQDPRDKEYRGLGMLDWFKAQEAAGLLELRHASTTWRSVQAVASFSDTIFNPNLNFPQTSSAQDKTSGHDGVFAVAHEHVDAYLKEYRPVCLRQLVTTPVPDGVVASNFGISKGLTHDRVLIFPTAPVLKFLTKGTLLSDKSACGLYVGVTRAIYSVAFVVPNPKICSLTVWTPRP